MTEEYQGTQSFETPESARNRLRGFASELMKAELALKRARDNEVEKQQAFEAAERRALLSREVPRTGRSEGDVTVAVRDAWVADKCANERFEHQVAEAMTAAAKDHYRTMDTQCILSMAILKSIDTSFATAGK